MARPVLVIGLGGTGQWIACHVLKELMDLYGLNEPNDLLTSPRIGGRVRILTFDTDQGNPARVGRGRRAFGMGVGEVRIPGPMRLSVGTQVMGYAQEVLNGKHPWIGAWFDARWFLNQPTAVNLLNLTTGAQQFRPLGRVAVPYNLTHGDGGIRTALTNAIQGLANAAPNETLLVCLVGSLCGGTGAGMVADIAYLVQRIAAGRVPAVSTRAYLVLPGAFEGTVPDGGQGFPRRAFAAMRELGRFAREVNYEIGYPMYYAGPAQEGDGVVRGRAQQALFELVYYFDAGLVKADGLPARVEEGMALMVAEAILPWVDGQTSDVFLSHAANLTAQKADRITQGVLEAQAAVAGGIGLYSLQLPIQEIIEEWTYGLAREALEKFLGVRQEDATTKTVTALWEDRAGGVQGISGRNAARAEWEPGQIGGRAVSEFVKEVLRAGRACREGPERKAAHQQELMQRQTADWQRVLAPPEGVSDTDEALMAEFLHPPKKVLKKDFLGRPTKVIWGQVRTCEDLAGDARRDERRNPALGAERVHKETEVYLERHLGPLDQATGTRGGCDSDPSGQYPQMLRRWCCRGESGCREGGHVADYRGLLRHWVALSLNGVAEAERTPAETPDTAVQRRSGRLGCTLALLEELEAMLNEAVALYQGEENRRLGQIVEARGKLPGLVEEMKKDCGKQETYLEQQQKILEQERAYACVRALRWSAEQMLKDTQKARESLRKWKEALCANEGVYQGVWRAQEQVQTNLAELRGYSAVREVVDLPQTKAVRYQHYAQEARNALGETLNALRWRVEVKDVYDKELVRMVPRVVVGLDLNDQSFTAEGRDGVRQVLMEWCRRFFEPAREHETVIGWLRDYYDGSSDERRLDSLAARLSNKGRVTLRQDPGANPYTVAYVRAHWRNAAEQAWVNALLSLIRGNLQAPDQRQSQPVDSTDPYRLTLMTFHELVDMEKLTSYSQGKAAYLQLPARSAGVNMARQLLHVFPAERNASVYEERLGKLLPDRVVALLEEPERFRQFVRAWAFGSLGGAGGDGKLIHEHRTDDGQWVYRLTTGPFKGEVDTIGFPKPAEHRWLCEPVAQEQLSLFAAAETFCLRGRDKWQWRGQWLPIDYDEVNEEIERQREALADRPDVGQRLSQELRYLADIVNGIGDAQRRRQAQLQLAELEHMQSIGQRIRDALNRAMTQDGARQPGVQQSAQAAVPGDGQPGAVADAIQARQVIEQALLRTSFYLDPALYEVMSLFVQDEIAGLKASIEGFRPA
jgi:hypothetical protein